MTDITPMTAEFEILEISRELSQKEGYLIKLFLFDGNSVIVKTAAQKMHIPIRRGRFYKNDWIEVIEEKNDKIEFELISPKEYMSYFSVYNKEFNADIYLTIRDSSNGSLENFNNLDEDLVNNKILLPLLNDTLPYSNKPMPKECAEPIMEGNVYTGRYISEGIEYITVDKFFESKAKDKGIIGKVAYKTRMSSISYYRKYPFYFFLILTSKEKMLKVIVWGEDVSYSSLSVGDIIGISKYRIKKPYENVSTIKYNRFSEAIFFDCKEISAKKIVRLEIKTDGWLPESIFNEVSGVVEYMSVLNRRYQDGYLEEYYLIRIKNYKILLFYNSSKEFYKIEPGKYLKITNLRNINRGNFEFLISSIYTQILLEKENTALSQTVIPEPSKIDFNISEEQEKKYKKKIEKYVNLTDSSDNESVNHISLSINLNKEKVYGAIGFVPDKFSYVNASYKTDVVMIKEQEYITEALFAPFKTSIGTIKKITEKMVLNESLKLHVEGEILAIDISNYEEKEYPSISNNTAISYTKDDVQMEQLPIYIKIGDETEELLIFVFNNFWIEETSIEALYGLMGCTSVDEVKDLVGKKKHLIINAFRTDEENILFYLGQVLDQ